MCTEHFWLAEGFLNKMDDRPIHGDRREARECRVKIWHVPGEFIAHVPPCRSHRPLSPEPAKRHSHLQRVL